MLVLPIKKKWFDMIKSGEKKEEYREIKPYYARRFHDFLNMNKSIPIIFRNGYRKDSPKIKCYINVTMGYGKEEWGAIPDEEYFVLKILNVEEIC